MNTISKKIILIALIYCNKSLLPSDTTDRYTVSDIKPITNILILNYDQEKPIIPETSLKKIDAITPKKLASIIKNANMNGPESLSIALCSEQIILCKKQLLYACKEIAVTLAHQIKKMSNKNTDPIKHRLRLIDAINQIFFDRSQEMNEDLESFFEKFTPEYDALKTKFLKKMDEDLTYHYKDRVPKIYKNYHLFTKSHYLCKEVNQDYILFIPKKMLSQKTASTDLPTGLLKNTPQITGLDIHLGLHISHLPNFNFHKDFDFTPATETLADTMNTLAIKPLLNNKERSTQTILQSLPNFNIFAEGHGFTDFAILDTTPEDIGHFLKVLNSSYNMQSLSIVSCYALNILPQLLMALEKNTQNLNFPILLSAIGDTVSYFAASYFDKTLNLKNFESFKKNIATVQGKYYLGPNRYHNKSIYEEYFSALTETKINVHGKKTIFPNYTKIQQLFALQATHQGLVIKYPDVPRFMFYALPKEISSELILGDSQALLYLLNVSQDLQIITNVNIINVDNADIIVEKKVSTIRLEVNTYPYKITIKDPVSTPCFVPNLSTMIEENRIFQKYYFTNISYEKELAPSTSEDILEDDDKIVLNANTNFFVETNKDNNLSSQVKILLSLFNPFDLQDFNMPISYFIKQITINEKTLYDVCIFYKKEEYGDDNYTICIGKYHQDQPYQVLAYKPNDFEEILEEPITVQAYKKTALQETITLAENMNYNLKQYLQKYQKAKAKKIQKQPYKSTTSKNKAVFLKEALKNIEKLAKDAEEEIL